MCVRVHISIRTLIIKYVEFTYFTYCNNCKCTNDTAIIVVTIWLIRFESSIIQKHHPYIICCHWNNTCFQSTKNAKNNLHESPWEKKDEDLWIDCAFLRQSKMWWCHFADEYVVNVIKINPIKTHSCKISNSRSFSCLTNLAVWVCFDDNQSVSGISKTQCFVQFSDAREYIGVWVDFFRRMCVSVFRV